ncbi:MAG TPA: restriction endonuclease [Nitrospiraceae bacterium]|nr:restriction endonuclease [Nitrospiraceae bacterium]
MIYNYRTDKDLVDEIVTRLRTDRTLSQGWGGGKDENLNIGNANFVQACTSHYKLATTRVPSNLTRLRDLKRGDILVTPHLPEYRRVSFHVVAANFPDCYQYVCDDSHQNHRIAIERSYGLDAELDIHNIIFSGWYGKLQWMRLPLLPIDQYDPAFRSVMSKLDKLPTASFRASTTDDYLYNLNGQLMSLLKAELLKIRPNTTEISFEAICEQLLIAAGYRVVGENQFNKKGGDIDLRCVRDRSETSPFEVGQTHLFVQLKKHQGTTDEEAVNQLLSMIASEPADGCVMSLADDFSETAMELAKNNGIPLVNGENICRLLLQRLTEPLNPIVA